MMLLSHMNWKQHAVAVRGLTFVNLLVLSLVLLSATHQLRLFASVSPPLLSVEDVVTTHRLLQPVIQSFNDSTNDNATIAININDIDQILSDPKFYERHDIRGANVTSNILLGHYWFPTQALLQQTTGTASQASDNHEKLLPLNEHQKNLLDDAEIIPEIERERCERYGLAYDPTRTERRRIFYGATLADDSFFLLQTVATEGYNLYHTVSFVESNMTHTRSPRDVRFPPNSDNLQLLQSMFGTHTQVSVEYFTPLSKTEIADHPEKGHGKFDWQHLQRQGILERWKRNGMRPDDIGFLADADELFSRDFLRALQMCDVPELRPHQTCEKPKIVATTLIYEGSPECIVSNEKLWHPDAILGECLEGIGDSNPHKPAERVFHGRYSSRSIGYGMRPGNYTAYFAQHPEAQWQNIEKMYPLWNAADYRNLNGGRQIRLDRKKVSHNAFHFHNFFESTEEIRHKYTTYGEPIGIADKAPLGTIHDDLSLAAACAHGWQNFGSRQYYVGGDKEAFPTNNNDAPRRPIFFENEAIRKARHQHLTDLILQDEQMFGAGNATCESINCKVHTS